MFGFAHNGRVGLGLSARTSPSCPSPLSEQFNVASVRNYIAGALATITVALASCDLPRDADGTLRRIRGGTVRVGVVVDTPWVTDSAGGFGGVEAGLVRSLARSLEADIVWTRGQQSDLLETLHRRQLDI